MEIKELELRKVVSMYFSKIIAKFITMTFLAAGHRMAGDLIALGPKPSGVKRHDREDSKISGSSKPSSSGGPSAKKFKPSPAANEVSGELFSDAIRVSQMTQSSSKTSQGVVSKQQGISSSSTGNTQIIEGVFVVIIGKTAVHFAYLSSYCTEGRLCCIL